MTVFLFSSKVEKPPLAKNDFGLSFSWSLAFHSHLFFYFYGFIKIFESIFDRRISIVHRENE
jgi:hypothetical protein